MKDQFLMPLVKRTTSATIRRRLRLSSFALSIRSTTVPQNAQFTHSTCRQRH